MGVMTEKKTIFLAGDSTVQSYQKECAPQEGWGAALCHYVREEGVEIVNCAMAGRSSRSFREEGRLIKIAERIKAKDYLFIQFGHNDAAAEKPERYVAVSDFGNSLTPYIQVCRNKKAVPVLITPIAMLDAALEEKYQLSKYREEMLRYAKDEDVPVMDFGAATHSYIKQLSCEQAKQLYLHAKPGEYEGNYKDGITDNAHLSCHGAACFAGILTELLKKSTDSRLIELQQLLL